MKSIKYFLVCLLAIAAVSCSEEPLLRNDDDDPIIIPPPKPSVAPVPLDSL